MCSKKSRRAAIGTTALPTPPAPMTRIRIDRVSPSAAADETPFRGAGRSVPGELPVDGAGEAVGEQRAGALRQIPGATRHVRSAIDDGDRDRRALVAEGHERPAWERPVGHPDERLGHRLATR